MEQGVATLSIYRLHNVHTPLSHMLVRWLLSTGNVGSSSSITCEVRTGVGLFRSNMELGYCPAVNCDSRALEQIADYIIASFHLNHLLKGIYENRRRDIISLNLPLGMSVKMAANGWLPLAT